MLVKIRSIASSLNPGAFGLYFVLAAVVFFALDYAVGAVLGLRSWNEYRARWLILGVASTWIVVRLGRWCCERVAPAGELAGEGLQWSHASTVAFLFFVFLSAALLLPMFGFVNPLAIAMFALMGIMTAMGGVAITLHRILRSALPPEIGLSKR